MGKLNLSLNDGGKIKVVIEQITLAVEISDLGEANKEK